MEMENVSNSCVNIRDLELGIMETEEEKDEKVGDVEKKEGMENRKGMVGRKLVRSHSPCNLSCSGRSSDTSGSSLKRKKKQKEKEQWTI